MCDKFDDESSTHRLCQCPDVHPHLTRLSIRGRSKVRVVGPRRILNGHENRIALFAALTQVVGLEIVCCLREAIPVLSEWISDAEANGGQSHRAYHQVVHGVDYIKRVRDGGVDI